MPNELKVQDGMTCISWLSSLAQILEIFNMIGMHEY